jgi:NACalpha-BTF3-like transcription factor
MAGTGFDNAAVLQEKANISYEDACEVLEACGGDLLEALVFMNLLAV